VSFGGWRGCRMNGWLRGWLWVVGLGMVMGCGGREEAGVEEPDPADYVSTKGPAPEFVFPTAVACEQEAVNEFIRRFVGVCLRGDYARYRLTVSRQVEPAGRDTFEAAWHAVQRVEIRSIRRVDDMVKRYPPPVYLVEAEVDMREPANPPRRTVAILVFAEGQDWVMAPAPRAVRQAEATTTQAAQPEAQGP
jgi:hypothetical protein